MVSLVPLVFASIKASRKEVTPSAAIVSDVVVTLMVAAEVGKDTNAKMTIAFVQEQNFSNTRITYPSLFGISQRFKY